MNVPQDRNDRAVTLPWLSAATIFYLDALSRLADADLAGPSLLPGWTRAHVASHVARNAEAVARLATWSRTGVENPMYESVERRNSDIDESVAATVADAVADVRATAQSLDTAFTGLDDSSWDATVRNAQNESVSAAGLPWLRARELWFHAIDLDAGATWTDLPPDVVDALLDEVSGKLCDRDGCPSVRLAPADRGRHWSLGKPAGPLIRGSAADLLLWVSGRSSGTGLVGELPTLPRWL